MISRRFDARRNHGRFARVQCIPQGFNMEALFMCGSLLLLVAVIVAVLRRA